MHGGWIYGHLLPPGAGLLAQGVPSLEAALTGVFIHGLAGDKAVEFSSEEALIAGDIMLYYGEAFSELKG